MPAPLVRAVADDTQEPHHLLVPGGFVFAGGVDGFNSRTSSNGEVLPQLKHSATGLVLAAANSRKDVKPQ